jgi:hypothetical protein
MFCRVWYAARLSSAGSDTLQDLVLRSLIPRRILFCRVLDPNSKVRPRGVRRKSFESLPFSLKGHFSKIVCMYKQHYSRHIWPMLKEPPILKMLFCSTGSDPTEQGLNLNNSENSNQNSKMFQRMNQGPIRGQFMNKTWVEDLVLLYL